MYLSILILPLLGAILSGFMGRKIGITGSHIITSVCLTITTGLAFIAFYEIGLSHSSVSIKIFSWIDSEWMNISWGFIFDSLTVSMLLPVLIVSSLVHIYSVSYMGEDPHNQRFFALLSMFTFFMLLLVTGDNYLLMFIGWEGNHKCPKWYNNNYKLFHKLLYNHHYNNLNYFYLNFWSSCCNSTKITSLQRIGPHNIDIISLIVGSTLGDTHLEK